MAAFGILHSIKFQKYVTLSLDGLRSKLHRKSANFEFTASEVGRRFDIRCVFLEMYDDFTI